MKLHTFAATDQISYDEKYLESLLGLSIFDCVSLELRVFIAAVEGFLQIMMDGACSVAPRWSTSKAATVASIDDQLVFRRVPNVEKKQATSSKYL